MQHSFRISYAARCMQQGGLIAYPTEAVWGLGCDPFNAEAVDRLLELKGRDVSKGLILIAASIEQLSPYLSLLNSDQLKALKSYHPEAVTWLVPYNGYAPPWIRGSFSSVALRITNHPVAKDLCRAFGGPIVSTSANLQGCPPAEDRLRVLHYFGAALETIVPGNTGINEKPSEIRDLVTGQIARPG